jgi:P22 coat protein - gene protein 5
MPNTLTALIPSLYNGLDRVSRELVGLIPAVTLDATYDRAAVGQTVMSPVTPEATVTDIIPGVTPPNDGDQTIGNVPMTITKSRRSPIRWNGEEKLGLDNNGASYNTIFADQTFQSMRKIVNEVEADLAALYTRASRAAGTPGTIPFNTAADLSDFALPLGILESNGAQGLDFQLALGTRAMGNLRGKQSGLFKVNEAGREDMLRNGITDRVQNMALRNASAVRTHVVGTAAAYTTSAAGFTVGTTSIPVITGTGNFVAGDVVTFAGDGEKYVVAAALAGPGTLIIAAPGLRQAIPAAATAVTRLAGGSRNMFFARSAIALATRLPAIPVQGDLAIDSMQIQDPISGLTFEIRVYPQYRQIQYEVALCWGVAVVKPEHFGLLID